MTLSITGFGYLILSFGLAVLAYRCFEMWKLSRSRMDQLFCYFFVIFTLVAFALGVASVLGNTFNITRGLFIFKDILFALGCGTLGYLIVYLKSPKTNPWFGFIPIFIIGAALLFLDLFQGQPFITKSGEINWGLPPIGYLSQFSMFLFTFLPMSSILFQQSKLSQNPFLKTKAFLFALVALGGFIISFIEFILEPFFNLEQTAINEVTVIGLNVVLFTFLFTSHLFTSQRDFDKKYDYQ